MFVTINKLNITKSGDISSFSLFHLVYYIFKDGIKKENLEIIDFLIKCLYFYLNFENKKYSLLISKNEEEKIIKIGDNELSILNYLQKNKIDENCKNKDEIRQYDIGRICKLFTNIKKSFLYFFLILIHL